MPYYCGCVGRPSAEPSVIARAFIAKAVYNMPTTIILIDRLESDIKIRRICYKYTCLIIWYQ
ncbi:transposase [sulfur-oxidizing endosymbiont of Gigantopelta aegis]|uniref:transposase n=1 Tax=sulfur-oxidizing endosymbiont of Gigantopelta aegis TaxID=2794934 RepID=UPI003CCDD2E3